MSSRGVSTDLEDPRHPSVPMRQQGADRPMLALGPACHDTGSDSEVRLW